MNNHDRESTSGRYTSEGRKQHHELTFYDVVCKILVDRWNKRNTPLHYSFLASKISFFFFCYSSQWL